MKNWIEIALIIIFSGAIIWMHYDDYKKKKQKAGIQCGQGCKH
jgi:hypothetical protein